jgi:hypothetical protein
MFDGGITSNVGSSGVAERNLNRIPVTVSLAWLLESACWNAVRPPRAPTVD